jgi:tagatose 6-phosphate kinase
MVFPRLAPDVVNRAATTTDGVAGKSVNVAKVLHQLGESVLATGFLGGDRGREVELALSARGINQEFIWVEAKTRQCITVIDQAAGTVTELVEESRPVVPDDYGRLWGIIQRWAPKSGALVMSGTITPGGPSNFYFECARLAREVGALPIVDAQGPVLIEALKAQPELVKPNRAELAATVGYELRDEAAVLAAMREVHQRGARCVVVTAGKAQTLAFDGQTAWRIRSPMVTALNPIGSGDSFTAGLVWRLVRGDDLGEACRWASAAGAANTLSLMAGEVDPQDVERLAGEVAVERLRF